MRFLFPPGEVKALSPRQWQGHRPCHSAAPGSGPAGGLKPPASARPAHGGRFPPAGSGAGLCVSRTCRSPGHCPTPRGATPVPGSAGVSRRPGGRTAASAPCERRSGRARARAEAQGPETPPRQGVSDRWPSPGPCRTALPRPSPPHDGGATGLCGDGGRPALDRSARRGCMSVNISPQSGTKPGAWRGESHIAVASIVKTADYKAGRRRSSTSQEEYGCPESPLWTTTGIY